jgi:hypothetical protein
MPGRLFFHCIAPLIRISGMICQEANLFLEKRNHLRGQKKYSVVIDVAMAEKTPVDRS